MFKAIVYTNKADRLTSSVVLSSGWDKKYYSLFAKGVNYDQAVYLHDREFSSEAEAKAAAQEVIAGLRKGLGL